MSGATGLFLTLKEHAEILYLPEPFALIKRTAIFLNKFYMASVGSIEEVPTFWELNS